MRQAGFLFPEKQMRPLFLFDQNIMGHLQKAFVVHFKHKNANILILASEKIDEAAFFSSLKKKPDEGHLKQMREGPRNNFFPYLIEK